MAAAASLADRTRLRMEQKYLHIVRPKSQVSGRECSSINTVGMHTVSTSKSATDRFMRNRLVELRKYFVLMTTSGTSKLPQTPQVNIMKHANVANMRMYNGNFMLSSVGWSCGLRAVAEWLLLIDSCDTGQTVPLFSLLFASPGRLVRASHRSCPLFCGSLRVASDDNGTGSISTATQPNGSVTCEARPINIRTAAVIVAAAAAAAIVADDDTGDCYMGANRNCCHS